MTKRFITQEQVHNGDTRKAGFIHTAEARINWKNGLDITRSRNNKRSIKYWHSGANEPNNYATFRFNPNNERVCSPCSGNMVNRGNCISLADFENVLTATVNRAGFERNDIDFTRVDFTVDYYGEGEEAERFQKLCDLLIISFIVKYNITRSGQRWSETVIAREPTSCKAEGDLITIERYNKAIQQPEHGATWRMEIRYIDRKNREIKDHKGVKAKLEVMIEELESLSKFYTAAQKQLNEALLYEFSRLQLGCKNNLYVNQYLYMNSDRLFSNAQVKGFFKGLGINAKKAAKDANNYSTRHKHLYIRPDEFTAFTEYLVFLIKKYLTSEAFFEDLKPKMTPKEDE